MFGRRCAAFGREEDRAIDADFIDDIPALLRQEEKQSPRKSIKLGWIY